MAEPKVLTQAEREALQEAAQQISKQVGELLVGTPFEAVIVVTARGTAARIAGEAAAEGIDADFDVGLGHVCFCDGDDDPRMVNARMSDTPEKTYAAFQAAGWIVEEAAGAVRGPEGETFCQECATFTCTLQTGLNRSYGSKAGGPVFDVPPDLPLPTCSKCGEWYAPDDPDDDEEPAAGKPLVH